MNPAIRFSTNVVKPWVQLSFALAQRYLLQTDTSDVTRMAASLAIEIKHQAELGGVTAIVASSESNAYRAISDVADARKHGKLRDQKRQNHLSVASQFEGNADGQFRFIRNVITINHASLGELDFLITSRDAISYLIKKLNLPMQWSPVIVDGPQEFHDEVFLYMGSKYQIAWDQITIMFVRKTADGEFVRYDPPQWKFAIYDADQPATKDVVGQERG